jgi:hypothetical protein
LSGLPPIWTIAAPIADGPDRCGPSRGFPLVLPDYAPRLGRKGNRRWVRHRGHQPHRRADDRGRRGEAGAHHGRRQHHPAGAGGWVGRRAWPRSWRPTWMRLASTVRLGAEAVPRQVLQVVHREREAQQPAAPNFQTPDFRPSRSRSPRFTSTYLICACACIINCLPTSNTLGKRFLSSQYHAALDT